MKLADLIQPLANARLVGDGAVEVRGVVDDSRAVGPGDVFVAVRGRSVDGHGFVEQAVARGAAAVVVEREVAVAASVAQIIVPHAASALGVLIARAAGDPAQRLTLVGVTGTNGKTTTTYLVEAMLAAADRRPGVIGTVSYRWADKTIEAPYTTPTPAVLHKTLADFAAAGSRAAVLEVSSAALAMDRMAGVRFQVAAFSNLTQDHLDVHGTMEAYGEAKARLFRDHLADDGIACVNVDDPAGEQMAAAAAPHRVLRVSSLPPGPADSAPGTARRADVQVVSQESSVDGIRAVLDTPRGRIAVRSRALIGHYNVANLALAVAIGEALELPHALIANGIGAMVGVPGRVERVKNDAGLDLFVDYAHTPDALTNVLSALKPLTRRRLICVFGCGGDRDPGKRPRMGAAVAAGADLAIVTSDNPRTEEPQRILDMILPAVPSPFFVDVDRRTAIRAAVLEATPGDVVVIAGKGHEDYQIIGTTKIHFDDREEAAAAAALRPRLSAAEVAEACGGRLEITGGTSGPEAARYQAPRPSVSVSRVVIDGRIAAPGDGYVAIQGERFDGHDFCAQAIASGARAVVIDTRRAADAGFVAGLRAAAPDAALAIIAVDDTRVALGAIARQARRRWAAQALPNALPDALPRKLVGVTGSTGKTTTKELIRAALSAAGRAHASDASLNNETGVPLTLLALRPFHDFAVVEMGMRGAGQIAYLADFAEPDVGVVVNAGVTHIELLGSTDAIAAAKAEIFARPRASSASSGSPDKTSSGSPDGLGVTIAVYPADDARLARLATAAGAARHLTFGETPDADVQLASYRPLGAAGSEIVLRTGGRDHALRLPLIGKHAALDAACALAAALAVGVAAEVAVRGLARARPPRMRGEIADIGGRHVVIDCYNANPASMTAALIALAELRDSAGTGARALAVLGDMLELGDHADAAHRDAGRQAAGLGIEVISLGGFKDAVAAAARAAGGAADVTDDVAIAARHALARTEPGDWILIKASRGMRLERVVAALREDAVP